MAPRSSWKGHLKLSLVSCQVSLFPASSTGDKVTFHMINSETGNRLRQQYVDSETGDQVEREARVKGYEVGKGDHVIVTDEEIDGIRIESSHDVTIGKFVPKGSVDPIYYDGHYYMAPDDKVGEEAFSVIRMAMSRRGVVGIARVVLFGRERTVMLEPRSKGILVTTLRYAYEVRHDKAYFDDVTDAKPSRELMDLATHLIDSKTGAFRAEDYNDRFQDAVVDLIRAKQMGRPVAAKALAKRAGAKDLLDALRLSLAKKEPKGGTKPVLAKAVPVKASKEKPKDLRLAAKSMGKSAMVREGTKPNARKVTPPRKAALTAAGRTLQARTPGRLATRAR